MHPGELGRLAGDAPTQEEKAGADHHIVPEAANRFPRGAEEAQPTSNKPILLGQTWTTTPNWMLANIDMLLHFTQVKISRLTRS